MSSEPPEDAKRPIRDLDVPIDESGADVIEKRRAERQEPLPVAAVEAMKLKGLGFTIMPLPTNQKSAPPSDWVSAARNNPMVFLKNPGTHNYAVCPPPNCFGLDVDKTAPEKLALVTDTLGVHLPDTLTTFSPNGRHQYYRWPEGKPRPKGDMFGTIVTRWPAGDKGQGYFVGPGSVVVQENGSLGTYVLFGFDDEDEPIADFPPEWVEAALAWKAPREVKVGDGPLAEVTPHYEVPESVEAGNRYRAILEYTAHMYNKGISIDAMWGAVQAELAPRFAEPLTSGGLRERFERAVSEMPERLGEPKSVPSDTDFAFAPAASSTAVAGDEAEHSTPSQEPGEGKQEQPLFVPLAAFSAELRSREPIAYLVEGWVPAAGLTVLAGHPKSMKSLAALQMLGAFVGGGDWLGRDLASEEVRVGLYLTREGSHSEMLARADALDLRHGLSLGNRLRFAYEQPIEFNNASFARVSAALTDIESEMSVLPGRLRVLLVLDPLRDLMPQGGDENEAKTMAVVKRWCRTLIADFPFIGILLVHHLRKSAAGSTGLEMSGSGAMYGAVDSTIIWKARKEDNLDDDEDSDTLVSISEMYGTYRVESRGEAPFRGRWRFDQTEGRIVAGVGRQENAAGRALPGTGKAAVIDVMRSLAQAGGTVKAVAAQVGISDDNARVQLKRLKAQGLTRYESGVWYADGFAPFQRDDVILPLAPQEEERPEGSDDDDEGWVDPVHRV